MTIDERALDLGFQALDRATADGDDELTAFRKGIETYEAECWRSIGEAPEDGKVLVHLPDCGPDAVWTATRADHSDWLFDEYDDDTELPQEELIKRGALFRTIDPPPQK